MSKNYKFYSIPKNMKGTYRSAVNAIREEEDKEFLKTIDSYVGGGGGTDSRSVGEVSAGYWRDSASGISPRSGTNPGYYNPSPATVYPPTTINYTIWDPAFGPVNLTRHLDKINNINLRNSLKITQTLLYCNYEMMRKAKISKIELSR